MTQSGSLKLLPHIDLSIIEQLHNANAKSEISQICIASNLEFSLGAESSFIHWLCSWAKQWPRREIAFSDVDSARQGFVQRNINSPFVNAIGLCATKAFLGPQGADNTRSLKTRTYANISQKQATLFANQDLLEGDAIFCADNLPIPLPARLYRTDGDISEVRGRDYFETLFQDLTVSNEAIVPIFGTGEAHGIERSLTTLTINEERKWFT